MSTFRPRVVKLKRPDIVPAFTGRALSVQYVIPFDVIVDRQQRWRAEYDSHGLDAKKLIEITVDALISQRLKFHDFSVGIYNQLEEQLGATADVPFTQWDQVYRWCQDISDSVDKHLERFLQLSDDYDYYYYHAGWQGQSIVLVLGREEW